MLLALATSTGCLITDTVPYTPEPPVTPPLLRDDQGMTQPRFGDFLNITERGRVEFRVPVDDENTADPLQYAFFVDKPRDCVAGDACAPELGYRVVDPNGSRRRVISQTLTFPDCGCHRVELWVSSRFLASGNFHTPARSGDVAFAAWWVFVRATPGMQCVNRAPTPDPSMCGGVQ